MRKNALLLIDVQNDFCDPNGALFVPGAEEDSKRTAEFIENILTRVTLPGACFLGFRALMPYFLQHFAGLDYAYASFFGGTTSSILAVLAKAAILSIFPNPPFI